MIVATIIMCLLIIISALVLVSNYLIIRDAKKIVETCTTGMVSSLTKVDELNKRIKRLEEKVCEN